MKLPAVDIPALTIVKYPDPVLRKKCAPVEEFGGDLIALAARMSELMSEDRGVGLAAPQVGVPIRLFMFNATGEPGDLRVVVNPELHDLVGQVEAEEGCLSLPEIRVPVRRAEQVALRACDVEGRPIELRGEGLVVRVWQHENDHLNGRLLLDYMTPTAKLENRRAIQQLEDEYAARHPTRKRKGKRRRAAARRSG